MSGVEEKRRKRGEARRKVEVERKPYETSTTFTFTGALAGLECALESAVEHPKHYNAGKARCAECEHPIECIEVVEHMSFNAGNAVKYLWRAGVKDPAKHVEDLEKARQYIDFEIERVGRLGGGS